MPSLGTPWRPGAWALALWSLASAGTVLAESDLLQGIQDMLESGNASAAASAAEAFIATSPGDPRLADAQHLLGRARERAGAWGSAWDQYSLFLDNFPSHPARSEVEARVDALRQRVSQRVLPPPERWKVASVAERPAVPFDDVAMIVRWPGSDLGDAAARPVTRAAVDGARVWIWRPLGASAAGFDPFDEAQVTRLEREFRTMAAWPIEGFVIDGALHIGDGSPLSAAAGRAYQDLAAVIPATTGGRDRLAWAWAGMRARASARALHRWVAGAKAVNPQTGWLVRVSMTAVVRPERALREAGEDLAELQRAAPGAIWAIDTSVEAGSHMAARLSDLGARPSMAVWSRAGDIVALH